MEGDKKPPPESLRIQVNLDLWRGSSTWISSPLTLKVFPRIIYVMSARNRVRKFVLVPPNPGD